MLFSQLGLSQPILRAVEQEGYTTPTPIQAQTIPHAIAGRDVLGTARTGTGKTAAFALPILQRLSTAVIDKTKRGPRKARALILSPTRELAVQIEESFKTYGKGTHLSHVVIYGGVSQRHQERAVNAGVDIIVATPGRLMDLMEQRIVDLSGIEIFVLDEADRMLDMGFIQPIRRIAATIKTASRQTLLFSATMPKEIVSLANSLLRDPVKIAVDPLSSAAPLIEQRLYMVQKNIKQSLLEHLLADPEHKISRALVFTRTKHGADKVGVKLWRAGIQAEIIHGNKSQNQRKRALDRFTSGAARVLVATDVAARGLDVDDISHVFNFDLPVEAEAYVHRIGRTGRAGATGIAVSFCDGEERGTLRDIERLTGKKIPVVVAPTGLTPSAPTPHSFNDRDQRDEHSSRQSRSSHPSHESRSNRPARGPSHGGAAHGSAPHASPSHGTHAARPAHPSRPAHPRPAQGAHSDARPASDTRPASKSGPRKPNNWRPKTEQSSHRKGPKPGSRNRSSQR